jgi:hypothetical protein
MAEERDTTREKPDRPGTGAKKKASTSTRTSKPKGSAPRSASAAERAAAAARSAGEAAGKAAEAARSVGSDAARSASAAAARVGRQTRETAEAVQKRVEHDLGPLAEKAGKELGKAQRSLGRFFKNTARATRKSARILAIHTQISAKAREAQRCYESIGERYYQGQKKSAAAQTLAKDLKPLLAEVDRILGEIAGLEAEEKTVREGD